MFPCADNVGLETHLNRLGNFVDMRDMREGR